MSEITLDVVFKVLEIVVIIAGGFAITFKLGAAVTKFEVIGLEQSKEITALKEAVHVMSDIVTKQAVQSQRLDNQAERVTVLDKKVDAIQMELWGPRKPTSPRLVDS